MWSKIVASCPQEFSIASIKDWTAGWGSCVVVMWGEEPVARTSPPACDRPSPALISVSSVSTSVSPSRDGQHVPARAVAGRSGAVRFSRLHVTLLGLLVVGGLLLRLRWLGEPMRYD